MPLDTIGYMTQMGLLNGVDIAKNLTPQDVHVNRPLTNISVAFLQDQNTFVADRIFPRLPVMKQSDSYFVYDRSFWNRTEMRQRPPSTETPGGGFRISTDTYFCDVYGLHMDVDERVVANADSPLAPRQEATEWVTRQGLLFREIEWTSRYFVAGVWNGQETGVAAAPGANQFLRWSDAASDPIKDVKRWKTAQLLRSGGFGPNVMVMSHAVYDVLSEHPDIIDRIKYGQTPGAPAVVTRQALAALFEIDRIEVLSAIQNTAAEGIAESNAFIAANHVALFYVPQRPGLRTPAAGYTFVWSGYMGSSEGQRVSTLPMPTLKSERVEIEMSFAHKVIGADLGFFAITAI